MKHGSLQSVQSTAAEAVSSLQHVSPTGRSNNDDHTERRQEYRSPQRWVRSTWRKDSAAGLVHKATAPALKRKAFVSEKGPTFLKTYAIPTLLINLVLASWDVVSVNIAHGWLVGLSRICSDCHRESVPLPGVSGPLPQPDGITASKTEGLRNNATNRQRLHPR
ncbi:MAG: hypothetical protein ACXVCM_20690 [Ktedonobacteraceae bacterium]